MNTYILPFNAQEIAEKLEEHNGLKEQLEVLNTLNKSYGDLNKKQQQLSETQSSLQEVVTQLTNQQNTHSTALSTINTKYDGLATQQDTLSKTQSNLQEVVTQLANQQNQDLNTFAELSAKYNEVEKLQTSLSTSLIGLGREHQAFISNLNLLSNEQNDLKEEYQQLAQQQINLEEQYNILLNAQNSLEQQFQQLIFPDHSQYFDIDDNGLIALKPEYRGRALPVGSSTPPVSDNGANFNGSLNDTLPEHIYIPQIVADKNVIGLQDCIFAYNLAIKTITLHEKITILPKFAFYRANNLQYINNTASITTAQMGCIAYTKVTSLSLPNLTSISNSAFCYASYLQTIDIGNNITSLPNHAFLQCLSLTDIKGGNNITSIGQSCFAGTRNLKTLHFLTNTTTLGTQAFCNSRIHFEEWGENQSSMNAQDSNAFASPIGDNTIKYWKQDITYSPSAVSVPIQFNQQDPKWTNALLGQTDVIYNKGCGTFVAMHIHAALSKQYYNSPKDFVNELYANPNTRKFVDMTDENYAPLGAIGNAALFFETMGYNYEILTNYEILEDMNASQEDKNNLSLFTPEKYLKMCEALSNGAMVFTSCTRADYQLNATAPEYQHLQHNAGHVVALFGINTDSDGMTEVYVLDSIGAPVEYEANYLHNNNLCTYLMPYQNFTGPCPGCIIVYPK